MDKSLCVYLVGILSQGLHKGWAGALVPPLFSDGKIYIYIYKITKIVRMLLLAERHVCMRVCKHGCVM